MAGVTGIHVSTALSSWILVSARHFACAGKIENETDCYTEENTSLVDESNLVT